MSKSYPKSAKISLVGLWIASFPTIGLQTTDASGIEKLALTSPTFMLQGIWTALCCLSLAVVFFYSKAVWNSRACMKIIWIVTTCFLSTAASIAFNNLNDSLSWLRAIQYFSSIYLSIISICILAKKCGTDAAGKTLISIIRFYFIFCVFAISALYFVDPQMAYPEGSGVRSARFGGSVVHPNTLALAAVLFLCTNIGNTTTGKGWILISSAIAVFTIIMTGSSGGLLLLTMWAFIAMFGKNALTRKIFVTILLAFFYGCVLLLPLLLVSDLSSKLFEFLPATWNDRLRIYQVAASGIVSNPVFGVGAFEGVQEYFALNFLGDYFSPPHSHNFVFDSLLSRGLVGGVPYLFIGIYGAFVAATLLYRNPKNYGIETMLAMLFFTIFVQGLMESSIAGAIKPFAHSILFSSLALMILIKNKATKDYLALPHTTGNYIANH